MKNIAAAALAVILSTSQAMAGPIRLTDALLDRVFAGRLAPESEVEAWVFSYVQYRKSKGKVSDWERTLTKENLAKRVAVNQGGKNANGPRLTILNGGNTAVFRVAALGAMQAKFGGEWQFREVK